MATNQTSTGRVCADNGDRPGTNRWYEFPAKNGKKAERIYELQIASNQSYGKGVMYITAQFRNPLHAEVASKQTTGDKVIVMGEMTARRDEKGRTWISIPDAKFQDLPPKKAEVAPPVDDFEDDDAGDEESAYTAPTGEDEDLPF